MSKVNTSYRVPRQYDQNSLATLLREVEQQLNGLSEGKVQATYNAHTAVPTGSAQSYQQGDFVRNLTPSEGTSTAGATYVVAGWMNTAAGSPGTFKECWWMTSDPVKITVSDAAGDTTTWPLVAGSQTGVQAALTDAGLTYDASTNTLTTTTFSGALSGTATTATNITVSDAAGDTTTWVLLGGSQTGVQGALSDGGLTYDATANALTTTTFIGSLTGNADTATNATNATNIGVTDAAGDTTTWVLLAGSQTGTQGALTDGGLTYDSTANALTATTFIGALTGNADTATNATNATNIGVTDAAGDTTTWVLLAGTQTGTQGALTDGGITYDATANALTATTFIGALTGNADTATTASVATTVTVANEALDTTCFPVFVTAATGNLAASSNANLTFNALTGAFGIGAALSIAGTQVVTTRQTGWAAPSSTLARTTFVTYPGQTITDNYGNLGTLFSQVQTIDDHVKVLSQRLGALITDLITHGLIGT